MIERHINFYTKIVDMQNNEFMFSKKQLLCAEIGWCGFQTAVLLENCGNLR